MEFEINGSEWNIIELSNYTMKTQFNCNDDDYLHGITKYSENTIYINKSSLEIKRTLKHELMHVWLYMYGHNQDNKVFDNEDVCEIVASSNDFINDIVDLYFRKNKGIKGE